MIKQMEAKMALLKQVFLTEDDKKLILWNLTKPHPLLPANKYRIDYYGNLICYEKFNDFGAVYGWEIVHIIPPDEGGNNDISNLIALHYRRCPKWSVHYREW